MNKENVLALADFIEKSDDLNMADWSRCIAGHAYRLVKGHQPRSDTFEDGVRLRNVADEFLGIRTGTEEEFGGLFAAHPWNKFQAARALRYVAEKGEFSAVAAYAEGEYED